jgi:hypothetical protein
MFELAVSKPASHLGGEVCPEVVHHDVRPAVDYLTATVFMDARNSSDPRR